MDKNQSVAFDWKKAITISYYSNTFLLLAVIGMAVFFGIYHITIMLYYSLIILIPYIVNYFIIAKGNTNLYIIMVYVMLTIYMCLATICLGTQYGFNMYCMSIIPIIYIIKYLGYKLDCKSPNPHIITVIIIVAYVACILYTTVSEPIYTINDVVAGIMFEINSILVFIFLITYSMLIVDTVIHSDKKLTMYATMDPLTQLYNRRYMSQQIEKMIDTSKEIEPWVALFDIDDFKRINDTYGHNTGDKCILFVSNTLKECCNGCVLSRWGGDEFLVLSDGTIPVSVLETLRTTIENEEFEEEGSKYSVTITVGVAVRGELSVEEWVNLADNRLYYGKSQGKNIVCF